MFRIESLLSARTFTAPQLVGNRIYFLSNLSGHLSLYAMDYGGSVPEPLLPADIALQNPHLLEGAYSFFVFPKLGKILVMVDQDGDEVYRPMLIPLEGGFPEEVFSEQLRRTRVSLTACDASRNIVYLVAESMDEPQVTTYRANLERGDLLEMATSTFSCYPAAYSSDHSQVVLLEGYMMGDVTLYLWEEGLGGTRVLHGTPIEQRQPGQEVALSGIFDARFTPDEKGILLLSALFEDTYSAGYMALSAPGVVQPVQVTGLRHNGSGEMTGLTHLQGNAYGLAYNIDGVSWLYRAEWDAGPRRLRVTHVLVGEGELADGVLQGWEFERDSGRFITSFCTATTPTQFYSREGENYHRVTCHTREKVLGIDSHLLSSGEDASFVSYDGTRISARLYLPAEALGFSGPRPVVFYIHGGPQGQERPDFSWFSMPLIQFLTLKGIAVFVPNARGSTGYGLSYTRQVDRDWGGKDRLDHVHAFQVLKQDARLDVSRAGVVGRSYGGYMTLTLAGRHAELWSAAVDMFGPYDLLTFCERIPETWKPYFKVALGDPVEDREFLVERSPKTHIDRLSCPMLVIQGRNDPRVVEQESHDLVDHLLTGGKTVEYLVFENEGHDVLKFENRVTCYNRITAFFVKALMP